MDIMLRRPTAPAGGLAEPVPAPMGTTRRRRRVVRAVVGAVVAGPLLAQAVPAAAAEPAGVAPASAMVVAGNDLPYGPNTCQNGFVWREARPSDLVCVLPDDRARTKAENAAADANREPGGGVYGPDTCKQGFVWREAFDGDVVCVTPDRRDQAKADNAAAEQRKQTSVGANTQTMTLSVAEARRASGLKEFDTTFTDCDASAVQRQTPGTVGWGQADKEGCFAFVSQIALRFDTAALDRIPDKTIDRAVLSYDESSDCIAPPAGAANPRLPQISCWQGGSGAPEDKPNGCVVARVPAQEWINTPAQGLRPFVSHPSGRPSISRVGPHAWDVTEPFAWQTDPRTMPLSAPGQPGLNPGFGFLLTGEITSLDQLTGDDDSMCLSKVSNITLQVTFTTHPSGGSGPVVK